MPVRVTVVGSVNLDLVARCGRLPRPGETVTDAVFERIPGGKGANQAVAAARLGAEVRLIAAVGDDDFGRETVDAIGQADVATDGIRVVAAATGVALILVDASGENQIVVAPGANARLAPEHISIAAADAVLAQLEVPTEAVAAAADAADGFFCLNAAPARPVPEKVLQTADLIVVNRYELDALGGPERLGLVALTLGPEGAILLDGSTEVARAQPPEVDAVDGTAAGDAFTACLVVSLVEGRAREEALRRACAAGAIAASRFGAQPSLPTAREVDAMIATA